MNRTDERNAVGRLGDVLGDAQQEHGEGQQDGDAERHLLAGVGRQDEDEQRQCGQEDARRDDVDEVEARFAAQVEAEANGRKHDSRVAVVVAVVAVNASLNRTDLRAVLNACIPVGVFTTEVCELHSTEVNWSSRTAVLCISPVQRSSYAANKPQFS